MVEIGQRIGITESYDANTRNHDYTVSTESDLDIVPRFHVETSPGIALVPLYRYYCPVQQDTFLTTDWSELTFGYATWRYTGIIGFVSEVPREDFVRLYRWFNESDRNHAYSVDPSPRELQKEGWNLELQEMYVSTAPSPATSSRPQCSRHSCARPCTDPDQALCLDHLDREQISNLVDKVVKSASEQRDHVLNLRYLSGSAHMVEQVVHAALSQFSRQDPRLYLQHAVVDGDLDLRLIGKADVLDLTGLRVTGSLALDDLQLRRLSLATAIVGENLSLRRLSATEALYCNRMNVNGYVRVDGLRCEDSHLYLDESKIGGVAGTDLKVDVFSIARCETRTQCTVAQSDLNALIGTAVRAGSDLLIRKCIILQYAGFREGAIRGHLGLEFGDYGGPVSLINLKCGSALHLAESVYRDSVDIRNLETSWLDMHEGKFLAGLVSAEVEVEGTLDARDADFLQPVWLSAKAGSVILDGAIFRREVSFQLDGSLVSAVRCKFDEPSRIARDGREVRLLDLADTDMASLRLDGVDLTACSLQHAVNLSSAELDGNVTFAEIPRRLPGARWYRLQAARPVCWDEILFFANSGEKCWTAWRDRVIAAIPVPNRPLWALEERSVATVGTAAPQHLVSLYRDLRRSLENRDEEYLGNGFYYSECTVRRRYSGGWQRLVLTLYWIFGGYGVRPSRPLTTLAILLAVLPGVFTNFHLLTDSNGPGALGNANIDYVDSLRHVVRSSTSVLGTSEFHPVSIWGIVLESAARVLVPLLLGLAFVGLRSIVRRGR